MKKRLGVIGGMGAKAGADFVSRIADRTVANSDAEHIDVVLLNRTSVPDRTIAIRDGTFYEKVQPALLQCVRELETLNVGNIVIACNTAHYGIQELQSQTKVQIINILDEAAKRVKELSTSTRPRVGIMATDGTLGSGVYHSALEAHGLTPVSPSAEIQKQIMHIIYDQVKKSGTLDVKLFAEVCTSFIESEKLDFLLLGCTELSLFSSVMTIPDNYVDALEILAEVAIAKSGYQYKN